MTIEVVTRALDGAQNHVRARGDGNRLPCGLSYRARRYVVAERFDSAVEALRSELVSCPGCRGALLKSLSRAERGRLNA
jgi:hypothetical protein